MTKYESVRFFLFTHSYSSQLISEYFKKKFKNKNLLKNRKLAKEIKHLSCVLSFSNKSLMGFYIFGLKQKCPLKRVSSKIKIYLEIEKELAKIVEEKLDSYSTAKEDYQRQLLSPAIERAAGNSLGKIEDDSEFDAKLDGTVSEYRNIYYKVAYKYKLPTIRIVPFLVRLINM